MIKCKSILFINFIFINTIVCQNMHSGWIVNDPELTDQFIGVYQDSLFKQSIIPDHYPQKDDKLIIRVEFERNNNVLLKEMKSKDQNGLRRSFDEKIIEKLDLKWIKSLTSRKYSWEELNKDDLYDFEIDDDVVNVYTVRNYKRARDAFWWTFREFDLSSDFRFVIRPAKSNFGVFAEQGLMNAGYSQLSSRTLLTGIASELGKFFIIVPWVVPYEKIIKGRPLDGFWGTGISLDSQYLGCEITYQNPSFNKKDFKPFNDNNDFIFTNISATIYLSNTYYLERKTKPVSSMNKFGQQRQQIFPSGSIRIKAGYSFRELNFGYLEGNTLDIKYKSSLLESSRLMAKAEYISDDDVFRIFGMFHFGEQMSLQMGFDRSFVKSMKFLKLGLRINYNSNIDLISNKENLFTWEPGYMVIPSLTFIF